jgi:sec-independent protein translocase protein TatB
VFGLTFEKLLLIGVIAVFIIGPERLPAYSAKFGQFVRKLKEMSSGAKDRIKEELGDDFDEVEWKKLDPRQYDPRRIIREALLEDSVPGVGDAPSRTKLSPITAPDIADSAYAKAQARKAGSQRDPNSATPFDLEST